MKPYSKTLWRTIGHNKGRFLANFFICLLSVFVSSGLAACPDSFQESFSNGYVGNPPDIIVKGASEDGLSQDQIDSISSFGETFAFSSFDFTPDDGESYYRVYLVDLEAMGMAKPVISEGEAPSSLSEAIAISQLGEFAVGETLSFDLLYPISSEVPDSMKGMLGLPSEYKVVSLSEDDLYRSHAPETAMVELEGDETAYLDGVFYLDSSFLDNPLLASMLPTTDCYLRLDLDSREYFSSDYSIALASAKEELEGETAPPAQEGGEQTPEEEKPQDKPQEKPAEEENLPQGEIISRRVRRFLAEYPAARLLKEGILAEIQADPAIEASPYCLEIALGRAAGKAYRTAGQYAADEEFIRDYVLTDKNIKGRIIEEYLSAVAGGKPPAIMASSGKMTASAPEKPASVSAAGRILERMLKERRI